MEVVCFPADLSPPSPDTFLRLRQGWVGRTGAWHVACVMLALCSHHLHSLSTHSCSCTGGVSVPKFSFNVASLAKLLLILWLLIVHLPQERTWDAYQGAELVSGLSSQAPILCPAALLISVPYSAGLA